MNKIDRYAIVFEPDKEDIMLHCYPGEGLPLEDLQDIVEGYIETVGTMLAPDRSTSGRCVEGYTGNIRGNGQAAVAPTADQIRR